MRRKRLTKKPPQATPEATAGWLASESMQVARRCPTQTTALSPATEAKAAAQRAHRELAAAAEERAPAATAKPELAARAPNQRAAMAE